MPDVSHPDAQAFTYAYDALDRLSGVYEGAGTTVSLSQFGYNARGLLESRAERWGSGVSYSYDTIGRLASQSDSFVGGAGNVTVGAIGYNPASQMVARSRDNDAYAWRDALQVNRNYAVNGLNQYTAAGPASFTYDANGNLIADGTNTYVYDAENRLISASNGTTLTYDPAGRLWQVAKGAVSTRFLYDGDALVDEYDAAGTLTARYVHGSNMAADDPLIWYENAGGSWRTRWLHGDHQGSIVAVTDGAGGSPSINTYDDYGVPAGLIQYGIPGAANAGRFQYTGQAWLAELGLYYYKARIYSPTLGRFLQTDPIGYDDQINLYAYVRNDPLNLNDASGKAPNKAGATTYEEVAQRIAHGGLASVAANGSNSGRYIFTETYGWVDLRHFATAAGDVMSGTPGPVEEALGFANEVMQWTTEWGEDYRSGFSPEDLPSNSAGIEFGQYASEHPKEAKANLFRSWARANGSPASGSKSYKNAVAKLPNSDPSSRGGGDRGSSNASSTPVRGRSNDNGSGSNTSNGNRGCASNLGSRIPVC